MEVPLFHRVGRQAEAVTSAIELVPEEIPPQRIVPLLLEIASRADAEDSKAAYDAILEY